MKVTRAHTRTHAHACMHSQSVKDQAQTPLWTILGALDLSWLGALMWSEQRLEETLEKNKAAKLDTVQFQLTLDHADVHLCASVRSVLCARPFCGQIETSFHGFISHKDFSFFPSFSYKVCYFFLSLAKLIPPTRRALMLNSSCETFGVLFFFTINLIFFHCLDRTEFHPACSFCVRLISLSGETYSFPAGISVQMCVCSLQMRGFSACLCVCARLWQRARGRIRYEWNAVGLGNNALHCQ